MVFLIVVVLSLIVTGCGEKTSKVNKDSGKIDLSLWYWNRALDDDLLEQVNEKFPEVNLMPEKIGGDFKVKVITTIAAGSGLPDILCLNDWIGDLLSNPDQFVNLLEEPCNAGEIEDQFLDWKWSMALTPDQNNLIALPLDTGPTAFFYRADLFEQAGLPTDPEKVSEEIKTWKDLVQAGKKIVEKTDAKMFENIGRIFIYSLSQQDKLYLEDESIYFKEDFFGGQETNRIFSKAASNIPIVYIGIKSDAFQENFIEQLKLIAEQNKDPEEAWKDAVEKCKLELTR